MLVKNKAPVTYEDWIDAGYIIIPCMRGTPIVKDWTNPNFKITKEEWKNNYRHCEIALRLDHSIDLDIDNDLVKRFTLYLLPICTLLVHICDTSCTF